MSKMTQKVSDNQNLLLKKTFKNKSCSTAWVDPKTVVEPIPNPKNSPLGHQKVKNDPLIKSKSKVRIEENIEN